MRPPKPAYREVIKVNIPYELQILAQWGLWRPQLKTDQWKKIPFQTNGVKADVRTIKGTDLIFDFLVRYCRLTLLPIYLHHRHCR